MINMEKMPMYVIKGGGKGGRERGDRRLCFSSFLFP